MVQYFWASSAFLVRCVPTGKLLRLALAALARMVTSSSLSPVNSASRTNSGMPVVKRAIMSGINCRPSVNRFFWPICFMSPGKNLMARFRVWRSYDSKLSGL